MIDYYILDKILDKIKDIICIGKFYDTKILVGTDDKLPDDIPLRNFVKLMKYVIKDDGKLYPQIFLEALYLK